VERATPLQAKGFTPNRESCPTSFPYVEGPRSVVDMKRKTVEYAPGVEYRSQAVLGVIGVEPPLIGTSAQRPPTSSVGISTTGILAREALVLPVLVPPRCCPVGMGMAVQGYGEVCLSAVKASLRRIHSAACIKGRTIRVAPCRDRTHYITMGLTRISTRPRDRHPRVLDFLSESKGLSARNALHVAAPRWTGRTRPKTDQGHSRQ